MAGDSFTYSSNNNSINKNKFRKWTNLKIRENMICTYEGECLGKNNINGKLCLYCKYRKLLDIPCILKNWRK